MRSWARAAPILAGVVPRVVPTAVAALGLVLAVAGVLMLTVAAPPQQVGGTASADPVLVTAPGVLALTGEPLEVSAGGEAFVGLGRAAEVEAFLDGVGHTRVDGVVDPETLDTAAVDGADPGALDPPADPALADIWQREVQGEPLRLEDPDPGEVVVVVAEQGETVTLAWQRSATHPGAWPLLLVGVLEVVLGLAWLVALNARRHRRRQAAR